MIKKILLLIYGLFSLFWLQAQSPGGVSTNLQRWYRADGTTTVVSGAVSQWNDMTANNVHLTQATAANRPAQNTSSNLINFNPSLSFDGTNDNLRNATGASFITNNNAYTAYYVAASNGSASRYVIAMGGNNENGFKSGTGATATSKIAGGNPLVTITGVWSSVPNITRSGFNGGLSQPYYLSSDGSAETISANISPSIAANAPLTVGSRPDATTNYWDGAVSEVIWYSGKHAAADYNRIESYLAVKYGITKAGNYINSASTTVWTSGGGYDNNIAGIGRDDMGGAANSGLNQKQSQSQNTGIQPVIGNVNIASTNAANTNTFGTNLSALVWGSDTGSTSFATSFAFGNLNNRMTRIWRVQETGTVGTVKVAIPASDLSGNITFPTLVVSSDAVFNGSDTRTAMTLETLGGVQYYTATVDFTTGQFFTFAALVTAPGGVISGLNVWLRGDIGLTGSTTWLDQSGNGRNLRFDISDCQEPALGSMGLTRTLNFNAVADFVPNTWGMIQSDISRTITPNADVAVVYDSDITTVQDVWGTDVGGVLDERSITTTQVVNDSAPISYSGGNTGNPTINLASFNGTVSNGSNVVVNGNSVLNFTGSTDHIGCNIIRFGDIFNANLPFDGVIGDFIVFNRNISNIERIRLNTYTGIKYGITLLRDNDGDSNLGEVVSGSVLEGDYVASNGTTRIWYSDATYQNNVAGIFRDDASGLNQKQSQSQNSGIQPVIGNGNIFDTNANNTNNFTADLSALVWGSDVGSSSFATSFAFGGLNNRMARIWKVQETGTVGTVKVALRATDLAANVSSPTLVVSSDAIFDGTDIRTAMTLETLGGVQYYTATVDFTSGQFFTFAAFVTAPGGVMGSSLWLKADLGTSTTTDGVAMSQWNDQSGNVNNVSQGTAANRPLYRSNSANQMNFNPTVSFDGTNDFMDATTFTINSSANTLFSAVKPNIVTGTRNVLGYGTVGTFIGGELRLNNATLEYNQNNPTFTPVTSGSVAIANAPLLFGSSMSNGSSGASVYQNNRAIATGAIDQFPSAANLVSIGSRTIESRDFYFNGLIPEVIAYNTLITAAERQRVNSYLAIKYGMTLDQSTVLNFNNGDFTSGNLNYWISSGNVQAFSNAAAFNGSNTTPNGIISQQITTVNGQAYTFAGDVNRIGAGAGTMRLRLDIIDDVTSVVIATQTLTAVSGTASFSQSFTGNGNNFNIKFTDISSATTSVDISVDNLTLTPNASTAGTNYLNSVNGIIWDATINAVYNKNIAGIGRDDLSALYQKQSQSVNSGSQVVMSLGTVAASNLANANTIAADKQFFIWGDDNGSLTTQVLTGNNTYTYRFTRIWKTQNTGTFAENMTMYYPVSAFGNALPATVALLYGTTAASLSNGTASAIAQSGTTTINGVSFYAFTVPSAQVANIQFFSFAANITYPGGVMGSSLWLKADLGTSTTTDGVAMSQWNDQSGNVNNVSQGTAANRPLYRSNSANQMNFNPTVSFDATNDFMDATTFTINGSANTLFSAVKPNVVNLSAQDVLSYGAVSSSIGGELRLNNAAFEYSQNNPSFSVVSSGSIAVAQVPILFGSSMNNVANGASVYRNNRAIATGTINQIPSAANLVSIGSRGVAGRTFYFNGLIPEVITYNSLLTAVQRQRVNSYLAIKYGITIDQTAATDYLASDGTTIFWNASANAAYNQNIAGIGRDDLSALHQKQSQSVNSGSQVVMSLGTVAASNQVNTNTIAADKQFFIWGDDNGSLTTQVLTGNTTYTYRFTRIWKTQNTGSFAENMTVYYPLSAFGNALPATVALLYGTTAASLSNGTATAIAQGGTTTINGASYYAFTVPSAQVANMQFFSFAGTQTSPGGVTGESLWLKADTGTSTTTDGAAMSQWDDQSGNSNDVIQGTAANRPLYRSNSANLMNFNPTVSFDGASDFMDATTFTINSSANTLFSAIRTNVVTGVQNVLGYGALASTAGGEFRLNAATLQYGQNNGSFVAITSGSVVTAGTPLLFGSSMNNAANGANLYQNNRTITTGTINQIPSAANLVSIGSRTIGGGRAQFFNGFIPEVVTYNSLLTAAQRQRINSYLGIKYGITLDQTAATDYLASDGTTILWNGTSNAVYNKNIAGIGRDDLSALYQKQSQSVNSGSQVVMALGTAAASNLANANTIAADKQFFIWGDDNGSLTTQVLTGNNTYTYRFTRVWKIQNTGSFAQNMTVYYPVSAFGNALPATVALLYGTTAASLSNGTASAIAQSGTITINGASYYAFTVPSAQVANMQFFSFAGTQTLPGGVAGVNLWLKADAGTSTTTNAATLSTWADQSGQRTNLATTSSGLQTFKNNTSDNINFNPAVYFDGLGGLNFGNDYIFTPAGNGGVTLFAANRPDNAVATKNNQVIFDFGEGTGIGYGLNYGNNNSNFYSPTGFGGGVSSGVTNGVVASIIGAQINFNSNQYSFINGLQSGTISITLPAITTTEINESATHDPSAGPVSIGRQSKSSNFTSNGTRAYQGHLSEVIHYSANLTAIQRLRVNTYLALKYGTTLTRNNDGDGTPGEVISGSILEGDYVASDGTTRVWNSDATYLNNIAGIGRDDLSALYQKQSQSVNTGSQVVMALGTVAASNQANANTIPTDKQFFIWGDDNGSLTNVVATGNATYLYRFTRVWKTQNTASFAQNMTVYYPVSAFGNASASTVALLYGTTAASLSNGTASAIAQSGTTTINGASYYAFTVPSAQVANMQFFSFAGTQTAPGGVSSELWLKADLGTSSTVNGSGISQWNDQSGNTNNVTQGTAGNQPSYFNSASQLVNFNPVVKFDGVDDELINNAVPASVSTDNTLEVVAVGFTTGTTLQAISHHGPATNNSQVEFLMNGATDIILRENCSSCSNSAATYTAITGGIPNIVGFNLTNGTTNLNALNVYNNLQALSSPTASVSGAADITSTTLIVGARRDNLDVRQNPFNGSIPEYIIFQQPLSSIERARVYSYTAIKYGVTLDQTTATNYLASDGTTILWNGTSNAAYNKNIAGIGRDDLSALYQKQSQSQNTGSQVVMALGTAAASNQANAGTIPTDKQFFIWGDDNGSLSTFVSTGNITYPSRFTRVWKTQNTGTFAQDMTVYYPVSAFGTSLAAYVGMIYGSSAASLSNGSASVIAQSGTTTINGVSYYVFTVPSAQVGGMQFFSFTGNSICYKPAVTVGTTLDTKHGITALNRAGTAGDNWPMVRKGAWTVLEAKTKGFVINRLTAAQIAAIPVGNLVEGMMVYDTTNNCMKVYTSTDGGTTFNWQCITTQTCPD